LGSAWPAIPESSERPSSVGLRIIAMQSCAMSSGQHEAPDRLSRSAARKSYKALSDEFRHCTLSSSERLM